MESNIPHSQRGVGVGESFKYPHLAYLMKKVGMKIIGTYLWSNQNMVVGWVYDQPILGMCINTE